MNKSQSIAFRELRQLLEDLGYNYKHVDDGEVFHQSRDRMLLYRPYHDREMVTLRDLQKTRSFLDDWGQLDAADFDAFLESSSKPA